MKLGDYVWVVDRVNGVKNRYVIRRGIVHAIDGDEYNVKLQSLFNGGNIFLRGSEIFSTEGQAFLSAAKLLAGKGYLGAYHTPKIVREFF